MFVSRCVSMQCKSLNINLIIWILSQEALQQEMEQCLSCFHIDAVSLVFGKTFPEDPPFRVGGL